MNQELDGLLIIGQSFKDVKIMSMVVGGVFDREIMTTLFIKHYGVRPSGDEEVATLLVAASLERLKNIHRNTLRELLRYAEDERLAELKAQQEKRMKDQHTPHEAGTTAQIAAKYGLSKAQVRKMKASGELDAFLYGMATIENE